jgi:hypothetical protein
MTQIHISPRKARTYRDTFVGSDQLQNKPLDYERYEDLNDELDEKDLVKFILHKGQEHKESLKSAVIII